MELSFVSLYFTEKQVDELIKVLEKDGSDVSKELIDTIKATIEGTITEE